MKSKFHTYKQLDAMDCGPTCVRMIAKHYGQTVSMEYLRTKCQYSKEGASLFGLSEAAESIGLKSVGAKLTFDQLLNDAPLPAIIYWNQYHFVVLTPDSTKRRIIIADPACGLVKLSKEEFLKNWLPVSDKETDRGVVLLLEPTPAFDNLEASEDSGSTKNVIDKAYLWNYIILHKKYFLQIFLGAILGSCLQLIFPYLTQGIVDKGINNRDITFIKLVLIGQLVLLLSQTIIEFIRNKILLYISSKINVDLLSNFWGKLLKLPVQFFETKHPGDIMQRIADHQRVENLLTGTALNTVFSLLTLLIFSTVLFSYSKTIFSMFLISSLLYVFWIRFFLNARRKFDSQRFVLAAKETSASMQLVYGMQEIKLNNAENRFRWSWESLQANTFKLNFKLLSLNQYQQIGAFFINQGKNVFITFFVAKLVIAGELTLGMMLSIQYIIGQLNSPIEQLISFVQQAQDAKMSIERLNDVHILEEEEPSFRHFNNFLPQQHDIALENVSFAYPGAGNKLALKNINLVIPREKVTAIVGMSGSGKTTLVKLLLRFYETYEGNIMIGNTNFKTLSPKFWRSISGAVMQDSFIFNDDIKRNIIVANDMADDTYLTKACQTANILSYIETLPLGFNTKLGAEGMAISGGQKQRIAIARAVYKNPKFLFFDEATNSLDANNEKVILENMREFFQGKTVVVVAHRLSTVKHADKIIVLENGQIVEQGSHAELILLKSKYYELVRNQLELGD